MALPQGWVTPTGIPQDIQDRVLQSYNQYWDPYNQARMSAEGSGWNIFSATGQKPWNYGFSTEGLSPESLSWLGPQAGAKEFANVDPFAQDWGRSSWSTPKPEGFLDSGMGWLVPLGLAAGVAGLQGAGFLGGAGEAAAAAPAAGEVATAFPVTSAGAPEVLGAFNPATGAWEAGALGAAGGATAFPVTSAGQPEILGTFNPATGAWEAGASVPAGGSWGGGGAQTFPVSPPSQPQLLNQFNPGTGTWGPPTTSYTPTGFFDKAKTMALDYLMPGGKPSLNSLSSLLNLGSGWMQSRTSKDAALEQTRAAQEALGLQRQAYSDQQAALAPYQAAGRVALSDLLTGLAPGGSYTQKFSGVDFENDPAYQAQLSEGMRAIQNAAAAKGRLKSGATMKEISKYTADLANRTYGDAYNRFMQEQGADYNRRAGLAGTGQTAVNQLLNASQGNIANQASMLASEANARAGGLMGSTNAWTGALSNLLNQSSQERILAELARIMSQRGY